MSVEPQLDIHGALVALLVAVAPWETVETIAELVRAADRRGDRPGPTKEVVELLRVIGAAPATIGAAFQLVREHFDQPLTHRQRQARYRAQTRPEVTGSDEKRPNVTAQDTLAPAPALARPSYLLFSSDLSVSAETKEETKIGEKRGEFERGETTTESTTLISPTKTQAKKSGRVRQAKALPPSSVDPATPAFLVEKKLPALSSDHGAEVAKMLDWHLAENKGRSDWLATWRNWLTHEGERSWRPGPAPGHSELRQLSSRELSPMPEYDQLPPWLIEKMKQPDYVPATRESAMKAIQEIAEKHTVRFEGHPPFVFNQNLIPEQPKITPPEAERATSPAFDPNDDFPPGY